MTRRFQFSLRALLGLAALVCVLLGGWRLLETYGSHIEANDVVRVGVPIKVRGRYFRLFGPAKHWIFLELDDPSVWQDRNDDANYEPFNSEYGKLVDRSWLCLYRIESEWEPSDKARDLTITLRQGYKDRTLVKQKRLRVR